ncbi:Smr/MutS family protein [Altibacter lentus]|uniref:Smr/MutS family protein n=1 Tax=Altibacter lentus TaxID=1223410 RepID=UPI000551FF40|nr:Smr/MutS family protein [Altibacter lentus]
MKKGTKVSVLDDIISGTITAISGDDITIVTDDGFEMQFHKNELVVEKSAFAARELIPDNISGIISEKETKKRKNAPRVKPRERSAPPMVVDLHIHQLVKSQKGLSNYDMLTIQTDTAKRQLDFAISKRIQRIVFIHGVGDGVLRAELEYLFKRYENIEFYDADYQKFGRGATEVYIFQNKTS